MNHLGGNSNSTFSSKSHNPNCATRRLDIGAKGNLARHLIELLAVIVLPDAPQSLAEVDARLADGLPCIPEKLMPTDADFDAYRTIAEKGRKKALLLPVEKIHSAFKVII
ncbi:unnamed protein product [Protopolystoma xenopodis]|uniref:Uncharacterized protein n=1 Tax=Protopolystoma xenopodis TaxID=117903 RepID=A0A448XPP6_9PLAT|nr:unnamed protein product [Protopolystoma xenopodis]